MEQIQHQLRLVVYPIIYKVFRNIPGGCLGFLPSTVAMENGPGLKIYFLLNMGDIPASYVIVYQRVVILVLHTPAH